MHYSIIRLFQDEDSCGCIAPEDADFRLFRQCTFVDGILYGALCNGRMVVLLAEVAQPDMFGAWCEVLRKHFCTDGVVEMPVPIHDTPFQSVGIRSGFEHLCVEVCFDDEVTRAFNIWYKVVAECTAVRDDAESERFIFRGLGTGFCRIEEVLWRFGLCDFYEISVAVVGIVHDGKGCDTEGSDLERSVECGEDLLFLRNLLCHHAVSVDAAMYEF